MKNYRNIKITRNALLIHKMRTLLALVGITIGVAAVILMVAIGNGAQKEILDRIEQMGTNLIVVNAGQARVVAGRRRQVSNVTTLTLKDSKAISEECYTVSLTAPAQSKKFKVKYGNYLTNTTVLGTVPEFQDIRNFSTAKGEFFSETENRAGQRVAVIGKSVQENLFNNDDPIGEIIHIGKVPFTVIGVFKEKGVNSEGVDEDDQIIIPLNTALRRVFNISYINTVFIQVKSSKMMNQAVEEIKELLRDRHRLERLSKPDDFTIQSQADVLETEKETSDTFTLLIVGIAAISLFVGGIGILAIMLMSIKERTNEIGLRMAVGARPRDILLQFLSEASILGLFGGLTGVIIGVAGSIIIGFSTEWETAISISSIFVSIGFSLSIGLFFGVYPARNASLLDPIEALRSE